MVFTGSSDSSDSDSESSQSSGSSGSKGPTRGRAVSKKDKAPTLKKVEMSKKRVSPPKEDEKDKAASIPSSLSDKGSSKQKSSRREELLKQLRAVEDAIARKRSKIT